MHITNKIDNVLHETKQLSNIYIYIYIDENIYISFIYIDENINCCFGPSSPSET